MKFVEATGKTVDEAIANGLIELDKKREEVEIEVIESPSKGFLGIIGAKLAKVKLTVIDDTEEKVGDFLRQLFRAMKIEVDFQIESKENMIQIYLDGPSMGAIIGRRGQTLDSIQYLVSLVANKDRESYVKVFIDTENYRKKREETLVRLANKMARKVKRMGKTIALEPMNPYERRIIHSTLQNNPFVQTYSEGEEPYRKVIISLKR